MIPDEPPGDVAKLLATERARLLDMLAAMGETDWHKPTPCPEWTVLGLCCHLLGDDLGLLSRHRDHHHGTPPPGGSSEVEFVEWLDTLQVEWVRATRRLSPRLVVDLLGWSGPQLVDVFKAQDPRARTALVTWAGPALVPAWLDQVREVSEYWIHRQQLRQALGLHPDLRPDLLDPILGGLRWAYPFRLAGIGARPGDTVTIAVVGPVTATWYLVYAEIGWDFAPEPGRRIVASVSMTSDEAWRMLTNNLAAPDQARIPMSGEEPILAVIRSTRAIIGTPI